MAFQISKYRKYIVAAIGPALPVLAHFMHIPPDVLPTNVVIYTFILGELVAAGVYVAPNKPASPEPPAV